MKIFDTNNKLLLEVAGDTLVGADLSGVKILFTNLKGADLQGANLERANLYGAVLSGAKMPMRYISVVAIGDGKNTTTYCFDTDTVWCDNFTGTLAMLKLHVNNIYPDKNSQSHREYMGLVDYLRRIRLPWRLNAKGNMEA